MTDRPKSASELVEQKLQALGKGARAAVPAEPEPAPTPTLGATGSELDMLRTIMFGGMQRDLDRRLSEMGDTIDALSEMVSERSDQSTQEMDARLTATRQELTDRSDRQAAEQAAAVAKARQELGERMEAQFGALHAEVKALSDELRQRHDALRTEIMSLLRTLEEGKASRQQLSDMLVELGQKLRAK